MFGAFGKLNLRHLAAGRQPEGPGQGGVTA